MEIAVVEPDPKRGMILAQMICDLIKVNDLDAEVVVLQNPPSEEIYLGPQAPRHLHAYDYDSQYENQDAMWEPNQHRSKFIPETINRATGRRR